MPKRQLSQTSFLPGALAAVVLAVAGCQPTNAVGDPPVTSPVKPAPTSSASSSPSPAPVAAPPFDAERAFKDLTKQTRFGPRYSGSPNYPTMRDWLVSELTKAAGVPAKRQNFTARLGSQSLPMSNIYAHINPTAKKQVMLCAHWDTRPTADQEVDPTRRRKPILGANDGASGVACLLEVARQLAAKKPDIGVQIVFFDGEDYGPQIERMFLGSKYYAKNPAMPKPDYAILIDMIGDKDLNIMREVNSENAATHINDKVWSAAEALGVKQFINRIGYEIQDDHLPLQAVGWTAIDLIDFDYGPWHTLDDTADKCSPESLKAVGTVLLKVIYDEGR